MTAQSPPNRESELTSAFVALADTLVTGYQTVDLLNRLTETCVRILATSAVGLMLADPSGRLRSVAASSEKMRLLELLELQNNEGPCLECYQLGAPQPVTNLAEADRRWPRFAPAARDAGFAAVQAIPLRLREQTIGAMNLFYDTAQDVPAADTRAAQALADMATIGILNQRALQRAEVLAEQLQSALSSRLVIEQAKGVLAERLQIGVDDAFVLMRGYARSHQVPLADTARRLVAGDLEATAVLTNRSPPRPG